MKAFLSKYKRVPVIVLLLGVLLVFFYYICFLNFSRTPSFYCTDMYSDMLYSVRAWEDKSLFPDGWVFGNQLYVIATPVLAALIYGIVGHPAWAMAIATVLMAVGVSLSFLWMLRPVFTLFEERLISLLCFIALVAYSGDAIYRINGWQLLFTMCSYYACYAITAFLCFGVFLRRREKLTKVRIVLLVLAALLSFATGIQSLRQTAVMLVPILTIEAIAQLKSLITQKKIEKQPLLITAVISASNLLGLLMTRFLNVPQRETFTSAELIEKGDFVASVSQMWTNMAKLLNDKDHFGILLLMVVIVAAIAFFQIKIKKIPPLEHWGTLVALFGISVLAIAGIDAITKMSVRSIYYFMVFPLIALLPAYAYRQWFLGKTFALIVVALLVVGSFQTDILPATETAKKAETNASYEISEMLVEKGYTTIYSGWNQCEDIAIASGGKITAGFWNASKDVFNPVMYLCDPSIYEVESDKCVYYLRKDNRDIALKAAEKRGVTMTLVAEYPQWGIWLYEASENLMQVPDNP